ncbi:MAG: O-antigen ligase family protein, partial [Terriglobales bacterium]
HTIHALDRQLTASSAPPNDLNDRLLSVSLSDRQYLWHAALSEYDRHRLLGGGSGSYAHYWLQHRPVDDFVVNAHSLYFETLAELGPIGVGMLSLLLVPPLIVGVRTRANPLIAPALGAYTAYLAHAAVDWDWQIPGVTIVAMIAGVVILLQDRSVHSVALGKTGRWVGGFLFLFVGLLSATGLAANHATSQGLTALGDRHPAAALGDAHTAMTFAPWSDEPYLIAGRAHQQLGQRDAALSSFRKAAAHDPADWAAWAAIANVSTGGVHRAALTRLLKLDPRYDFVDGRP